MSRPQPPPQPAAGDRYSGGPHSGDPAPPPAPPRKRRLGLKIALVVVAGLVAAALFTDREPERVPETGTVAKPSTLSVFDLRPGDCYNTREAPPTIGVSQAISFVEAVPCTVAHSDQVIAKVTYGATDTRAAVLDGRAGADCDAQFQDKLDPSVAGDPTLQAGQLVPSNDDTWNRNRVIACVVFSQNPITRSLLR